jgi:uncharacterized protein (TIGR00369 family)
METTSGAHRRRLPGALPVGMNCFACGPDNPVGLKIDYQQVGDTVEAEFVFGDLHSGAPGYVHGGILMTVLDDAMAWAAIAVRGSFAVTAEFTSRFSRPVRVGATHTVVVNVSQIRADTGTIEATGEIRRPDGKKCVSAAATYHVLTPQQVAASIDADLPESSFALRFADGGVL